jgi:uncharacterized protein (TIGR02679 family)
VADLARLRRLLGSQDLAALRARLRKRYEQGREDGIVTLGQLGDNERAVLCGLLGRPATPGTSLRFDVADLDAILQASGAAASLREALALLDGPIENRTAQRAAATLEWQAVQDSLTDARLIAWLAQPRALGALKRACNSLPGRAAELCAEASRVLAALPCAPSARSHLAARVLGDAHALDNGRAVASLVLAVLRHARMDNLDAVEQEESVRSQWAAVGVLINELARPVLFLNLPGHHEALGEPAYLSLRALLRGQHDWPVAGREVFVCENPNIVALAADALGPHCTPLVCTDGMPAAAQRTLLLQLATAGAQLRYHGDFDWAGIAIGNVVMAEFNAQPWCFGTKDYRTAIGDAALSVHRLDGNGRDAVWDAELKDAMLQARVPIDEEAVLATLLQGLRMP